MEVPDVYNKFIYRIFTCQLYSNAEATANGHDNIQKCSNIATAFSPNREIISDVRT